MGDLFWEIFDPSSDLFYLVEFSSVFLIFCLLLLVFKRPPPAIVQLSLSVIGFVAGLYGYKLASGVIAFGTICLENKGSEDNYDLFIGFFMGNGANFLFLIPSFQITLINYYFFIGLLMLLIGAAGILDKNQGTENVYFVDSVILFGLGGMFITGFNIIVFFIGIFSKSMRDKFKKKMYNKRTFAGFTMQITLGFYSIFTAYFSCIRLMVLNENWEFFGLPFNPSIFNQPFSLIYSIFTIGVMIITTVSFLTEWTFLETISIILLIIVLILSIYIPLFLSPSVFKILLSYNTEMYRDIGTFTPLFIASFAFGFIFFLLPFITYYELFIRLKKVAPEEPTKDANPSPNGKTKISDGELSKSNNKIIKVSNEMNYCPECGQKIRKKTNFCTNCGHRLEKS